MTYVQGLVVFLLGLIVLSATGYVRAAPQVTDIILESNDYKGVFVFSVSDTDIGDTSQGATTSYAGGGSGFDDASVIDGDLSSCCSSANTLLPNPGGRLEVLLDTTVNMSGYDITHMVNTTGWNSPGRTNHQYLVELRPVGGDYTELLNVAVGGDNDLVNQPPDGENEGAQITINDDGGGLLGTGIEAVRFTFHNDNEGNTPEAIQEIDIFGVPGPPLPPTTQYAWKLSGLGDWNSQQSWKPVTGPGTLPNSTGHMAQFGNSIQASSTVTVDQSVTVNRIEFDSPDNSYVIAGLGKVNLAGDSSGPTDPSIEVSSGSHVFQAAVNLKADTAVTVTSGDLSFDGQVDLMGSALSLSGNTQLNHSVVDTVGGGSVTLLSGDITGEGTFSSAVNNQSATVAPGNSPGVLTIDGDYTQGSGGTLAIEIAGSTPGEQHDRLVVSGQAHLAGTLDVTLTESFTPFDGHTFDILDFNSVSGDFDVLNLPANFDWNWDVNTGVLSVGSVVGGLAGDYNGNGTVDAADYTIFRDNLGSDSAVLGGNGSGAATVVQADYLRWKQNFGSSGTGSGSSAAVPEPASVWGWLVGVLGCWGLFRRSFGLRIAIPVVNIRKPAAIPTRKTTKMWSLLIACVATVGLSGSTVWGQILLPNGQPDPAFNSDAMQVWLRADSGVTADQDGRVSDWQDRSNNDNDATQENTDIQPRHATGSFGGREVVNFVGPEAERIYFGTDFASTFQGSFTAFYLVAPEDGQPNGDRVIFGAVGADSTSRMVFAIDNAVSMNHLYKVDGASGNTNIAPMPFSNGAQNDFTLISYVNRAGGTHEAFVNGDSNAAASADNSHIDNSNFSLSGSNTNVWLGSANNGNGASWPNSSTRYRGGIAEFMIYQGALSTSDREAVEDYLLNNAPVPVATDFEWNLPGLGTWHSSDSWNAIGADGTLPNGSGNTAIFGNSIQTASTVTIDEPVTVNRIEFDDSASKTYAISGSSSVNLEADASGPTNPSIEVNAGSHLFQAAVNLQHDTTVTVNSGNLSFDGQIDLIGNMLSLAGNVSLNHSVVDTVGGGSVSGSGTLGTEGDTAIAANLALDGATVDLDLRNTTGGVTSDRFDVEGSATLTGNITVNVDLVDGFSPSSDVAILTTTGGIVDNSLSLSLTGSGQGAFTGVGVVGNNLVLQVGSVTLDGDYNSDGVVNAADYTLWADNLGTNNPLANDTIGGLITEAHYLQWKNNFGNAQSSGSGAAVPEPVSLVLLLLGVIGCCGARARKARIVV